MKYGALTCVFTLTAGAMLAACGAAAGPSRELVTARQTMKEAQKSEAAEYAPGRLYQARRTLRQAERVHRDAPGSRLERDLAYIAERQSREAMAAGRTAEIEQKTSEAESRYQSNLEAAYQQREMELGATAAALLMQQHQIEQERMARMEAEDQARAAEEAAGKAEGAAAAVSVPIDGPVFFASGQSELLPSGRRRLSDVADALAQEPGRTVVLEGHADASGPAGSNMDLSRARAESARQFLVGRGVPQQSIRVVAKGESEPVATNATPEGRANNRRVEVVSEGAAEQPAKPSPEAEEEPTTPEEE